MKKLLKAAVLYAVSFGISACDLSPDALVGSRSEDGFYQTAESPRVDHCDRKVGSASTASCFTEELGDVVADVGEIRTHGTPVHYPKAGETSYGGFSISLELKDKTKSLKLGEVVYRREGSSDEVVLDCLYDKYMSALGNTSYNCALIGKKRTPKGLYILKSIEFTVDDCVQRYETESDKGHCTHNSSTVDLGSSYVRAPGITVHEY